MANTYQGHFPTQDSGTDGFTGLAPVAQYAPNGYGLYDMAGNVWQWTSDWYRPDYYTQLARAGGVARNPKGPDTPFRPRRALGEEEDPPRRLVSLHRSVLLTLHGRNARQGRGQYGNKSPGLSLCLDYGSVRNRKFSQILKADLSIEEPCGAFQTILRLRSADSSARSDRRGLFTRLRPHDALLNLSVRD